MRARVAPSLIGVILQTAACSTVLGIEDRPVGDPAFVETGSIDTGPDGGPLSPAPDATGGQAPFPAPHLGPPGCDQSPPPLEERCGIFVATSYGVDTFPGSITSPKKTLHAAVDAAIARKLYRVFVCGGPYAESITLGAEGVTLLGGYACDNGVWKAGTAPSTVHAPAGVAIKLDHTANAVAFDRMRFEASDVTEASASSISVWVDSAASVTFRACEIAAGAGARGSDGAPGEVGTGGGAAGGAGNVGTPGTGAACTCTVAGQDGGSTSGGNGGVGVSPPTAGLPALGGGAPGTNAATCTPGGTGANGADGATPPAAAGLGTMSATGWAPRSGEHGTNGAIGQGGGGGGAYVIRGTIAGGGGGCGGCGSSGGGPGTGGGASIAIFALGSGISLDDTLLITGAAGAGGSGGAAPGGQGGGGGAGNSYGYGCAGGTGGSGGKGGDGGGGAGGIAVGVLYSGLVPVVDVATQTKAKLGAAGGGGTGGIPGQAGVSQVVYTP